MHCRCIAESRQRWCGEGVSRERAERKVCAWFLWGPRVDGIVMGIGIVGVVGGGMACEACGEGGVLRREGAYSNVLQLYTAQ